MIFHTVSEYLTTLLFDVKFQRLNIYLIVGIYNELLNVEDSISQLQLTCHIHRKFW